MSDRLELGPNTYGKADVRLVHVDRSTDDHRLTDLTVSIALGGDLDGTHLRGDNSQVLPTDSQKNTVYAFAREGVGPVEGFAVRLARHFVTTVPTIHTARVHIVQHGWTRIGPHSLSRNGRELRTATINADREGCQVVSGVANLVLLKTTGSEFHGFLKDRFTTLPETTDRILATTVNVRWRHTTADVDWDVSFTSARSALIEAFAGTYSYSLQQTLYAMGERVLQRMPGLAEVRLALPNRHHTLVDLRPFGLDNPDTVYIAADRPYGLIEGTVRRDQAEEARWDF